MKIMSKLLLTIFVLLAINVGCNKPKDTISELNVKEAQKLRYESYKKVVFSDIRFAAEDGRCYIIALNLTTQLVKDLESLGYKVSDHNREVSWCE